MSDAESAMTLKRIEQLLESLLRLQMATALGTILADDHERRIYELTGKKTSREICKELSLSPNRLSELWTRWQQLGLLVKDGKGYQKVIE